MAATIYRPPVHYIALAQLVVLGAASGMLWWFNKDPVWFYSWACGGLVAVAPQACFAWQVFRHCGARAASEIAKSGYVGEIGKFLLTAAGFALIFALVRPISGGVVFVGYGVMLIIQLAGSWLLLTNPASYKTRVS